MLLSEGYLMFIKCFEDENPYTRIMAMDYHWSHVSSDSQFQSEAFETTSNSKLEEMHRYKEI